jgi:signal transduction histidine kinase
MKLDEYRLKFATPLKVLVVEDNLVDQRILESMLTESPHITSFLKITGTITEALKFLEQYEFDIIVLDLNLPDSRGVETLMQINSRFPHVSVVVNTGAYEDELGLQTLSLGAQDFLLKGKYNAYVLNKVLHFCLERKRLEMELRKTLKQLKDTQNQLIQTEKMKVVGGLASGIAHEVKNPLSTILYGVTYLAEQIKVDDPNYDKVLRNIREATDRANNIITDLLDFSSLSKLTKVPVDIVPLIEKSLSIVTFEMQQKKIRIEKDFPKDLPKLLIDPNRIEQVLVNVILNAVNAMPSEGKLTLRSREHTLPDDMQGFSHLNKQFFRPSSSVVEIYIEDNGSGISEENFTKVFDPFFTTRRAQGGVGLGLSVCKNIMEIHEGDINISNIPTGGVRVTLSFNRTV